MQKLNMKQWIAGVIAQKQVAAIPIMTHPGIELIGSTVRKAVTDGEVHYRSIKALADKYPTAGATVIMDLTVEAECFGADIAFEDDAVPAVVGHILNSADDIRSMQVPPLATGRIKEYLKANLLAARNITDRPVFAGCIGPFSLAGRLYDMSEIMVLIYQDPEAADILLGKCTDFILKYCMALKETGVAGVVMAEPAAGLMSDEDCERFSSVFVKRVVDAVQDDSFSVVLHNCGNTGQCTHAMAVTGAAIYHFGNKIDMVAAIKGVPAGTLAVGNIDPVQMFKDATPEEMYAHTMELLNATRDYPNFVLSSGCDTPPATPFANIDAFFRALDDFNKRS